MNYKLRKLIAASLCTALMMTFQGCAENAEKPGTEERNPATGSSVSESGEETDASPVQVSAELNPDEMFSSRDKEIGYDESTAVSIVLKDNRSECASGLVSISDNTITIKGEGTFLLSGSLSNGQVIVDAGNQDKIQLVFNQVDISSSTSAPLYVRQADKVFLTLAEETKNSLSNQNGFTAIDENNIDAVIFSKDDLTLNGSGELSISSAGHAVVSKDDLVITGGTYQMEAAGHALSGKESVRIANGSFELNPKEDGIHSEDKDDESLGFVYIAGGDITVHGGDDGIHAFSSANIAGGKIEISGCNEGIEGQKIDISSGTITVAVSDDGLNAAGGNDGSGMGAGGRDSFASDENCYIRISGGTLMINANGDGVDSNGALYISGGTTYVSGPQNSGNGALDYNGEAQITGGIFIAASMSGMEQNFGDGSTQGSILVNASQTQEGAIVLKDREGKELVSYTPEKAYNSVVISMTEIVQGETYEIVMGEESTSVEMTELIYGSGHSMGGRGGHGGGMGRPGGSMQKPGERGGSRPEESTM